MKTQEQSQIFGIFIFLSMLSLAFIPMFYKNWQLWLFLPILVVFVTVLYYSNFNLFGSGLYCLFQYLVLAQPFTDDPRVFYLPIIFYLITVRFITPLQQTTTWLKVGTYNFPTLTLALGTTLTSSTALILWFYLSRPDIGDLLVSIPDYPLPLLLLLGIVLLIANAILEELIFRGILWEGIEQLNKNFILVILFQAALFGLCHYRGFPRGNIGMILAGIYGLLLGIIKYYSFGLLLPVITHIFADLTIFLIILNYLDKFS
jgi:uncharacterized protein